MKLLTTILLILFALNSQGQTANAGADKTIYLTQTSSTTLDGSASTGTTFLWREISTDYMSGAAITNSTSKVATVSGLPQGVFYFEIAATTGGTTKRDSVMITVCYNPVPKNTYVYWGFPIREPGFISMVNSRFDTTNYVGYNESYNDYAHSRYYRNGLPTVFLERSRMNGMMIDSLRGKFYTTVEDGYDWNFQGYARSQINVVNNANFGIDTNKTYIFNWQIYFPQSVHDNFAAIPNWGRVTMWDIHGADDEGGQFGITLARDSLVASDRTPEIEHTGQATETLLLSTDEMYNKAHTIRIIYREGSASTGRAFIRVEVDGVLKYSKYTGKVGKTLMEDYVKTTGLYDYRNLLVDVKNYTRHKKFALVTMDANVHVINPKPTVDAGLDQSIGLSSTTLNGTADDLGVSGSGVITSYAWTKLSGGAASITSSSSASTGITGLANGTYLFELAATDNSGLTGRDTVQIIVATSTAAPTLTNNGNQSITVDSTSVGVTVTWAAGHTGTYSWTQTSGPSTATIPSYLSAATYVKKLITGTYVFRCTITQDDNQTAYSEMTIIVSTSVVPLNVSAGGNKSITVNNTTLTGSATGTITSYKWTKISGGAVVVATANAASTTLTGLVNGIYKFSLTATNSDGLSAIDTMQLTVTIPSPTVNAGVDQTLTASTGTLTGTASDAGTITSYLWSKVSGGTITFGSPSSASTSISGLKNGIYLFSFRATNNSGLFTVDTMQVTVNIPPPTVNAGTNQSITISSGTLSGSATGSIASYSWSKVSGGSATISSPSSASTSISGLGTGVYQFQLTATNTDGVSGSSTVQVTVSIPVPAPTITTTNKTITTYATTLSATATTVSGHTSTYSWKQMSGDTASITNTSSLTPNVIVPRSGIYVFRVTITQDDAQTAYSDLTLTVNIPVAPPTVSTVDTIIATNLITLSAKATSATGHNVTYSWVQRSGVAATITNGNTIAPSMTNLVTGVYIFRITVTQDDGQIAYSDLNLRVIIPNIPPTVDAGPDQFIQLPTNTTSFSGAATPAAGTTISSVMWSKTSGGAYGMTGAGSLTPSLTGLNGVYVFRLTATQSDALTAYSELGVMALSIPISQFWKYPTIIIFKNIP